MTKQNLKFMEWYECERNFIRHIDIDNDKIKSIIRIASNRHKFIQTAEVNNDTVSFVVENYYEIIKELLTAILIKNKLKSKNHQCLISFFYRQYPQYEFEANLILQMSYLRNRLNYYGESIDIEFYNKHKKDFEKIISLLVGLIQNEAPK